MSMFLRNRCNQTSSGIVEFEWLEYIEGQCSHQYIDTGQASNERNSRIYCTWMLRKLDNGNNHDIEIFGNYSSNSIGCERLIASGTQGVYYVIHNWVPTSHLEVSTYALDEIHSIRLENLYSIYIDNKIYDITDYTKNRSNSTTIKIFSARDTVDQSIDNYALRIYEFKQYNRSTIIRDLRPCKYWGEVGMYDTVSETFFGNIGTGSFVAGPKKIEG